MADELPITPESGPVAAEAMPTSQAIGAGQQQPRKPSLADVLAKQSRGETLTAQDRGVLGAAKRKAKAKAPAAEAGDNLLLEVEPPASQLPPTSAAASDNPLLGAEGTATAAAGAFPLSAADSENIRAAAEAILDGMDTTTKLYIGYEARKAGGDDETVKRYESAVALKSSNRELMAKNSEPVVLALCKFFRCTPDKLAGILKNSQFFAGLFSHAMTIMATVKSIRESQKEKPA